jgi:transaldolase
MGIGSGQMNQQSGNTPAIHTGQKRPAVFLDRDGVLNESFVRDGVSFPPSAVEQFRLLPGVVEGVRLLESLGYLRIIVTNQPDVARGTQTQEMLDKIHEKMQREISVDGIYVCTHDTPDKCDCRKPLPGLLIRAARDYNVDLSRSFMIGDRWSDVAAGAAAGCRTFLIPRSYSKAERCQPDFTVDSVLEAAQRIANMPQHTQSASSSTIPSHQSLKIKIFADGADKTDLLALAAQKHIAGFTTNPTLMRKAGVVDYRKFALDVLSAISDRPISFEVFSDEFDEMERQATEIASWGQNVYVKIPVTNTRGESAADLISRLSARGIKLNVTALTYPEQVSEISAALGDKVPSCISVFAGRVADTGRDPLPIMIRSLQIMKSRPNQELIWASPRELLNIIQADQIGCHIITVTNDLLKKLPLIGKDLKQYSLETVAMFRRDAVEAKFTI